MSLEEDKLFGCIERESYSFSLQAKNHKWLTRALWGLTAFLTVLVAMCTNFPDVSIWVTNTSDTAKLLSIIVPVVGSYTLFRSPEALWVSSINFRNKTKDLKQKMIFAYENDTYFDRAPSQVKYLEIMKEANGRWLEIKSR